jgi:CO/xanthine dehydrogenase Mo-binding subunit
VDLLPSGKVRVTAGATSLGQGVETVLAILAAERLGLDADDITVVLGDTDLVPEGTGSWASRSTVLAGNAVTLAAHRVAELAREWAAEALEVATASTPRSTAPPARSAARWRWPNGFAISGSRSGPASTRANAS